MHIIEHTPQRLTLEYRPKFMAGLLWFMGLTCIFLALSGQTDGMLETVLVTFLGVGILGLAHHFFPFQRLTFDRTAGLLTKLSLTEIERAAVQAQWADNSRMERLILIRKGEKFPVEYGFYSRPRDGLAKDINSWLAKI